MAESVQLSKEEQELQQQYDTFLRFKTFRGFEQRGYPLTEEYVKRINYELGIIAKTRFSGYFLVLADLCRFMRENKIRYCVRGSGCGSVVVWGLGISHKWLDPVKYKIPFERFLNPERVSNPDIDVDICDTSRHKVVEYTVAKYGASRVARIITFGTLGPKAAVKDVARALNLPEYQKVADQISAAIPGGKGVHLKDELEKNEFLREQQRIHPQLFDYAEQLEGKVRNASIHAAGTVIAPDDITQYMPVAFYGNPDARDPEDWFPTTQWDMYDVEKRGLLKMDYLGLKTLRVIDQCNQLVNLIKQAQGDPNGFDIDSVPQDDDRTWRLLNEGLTSGVFQVEAGWVRQICRRMNLGRLRDPWQLAILIAIIRPGMLDTGATESYLRRVGGQEPIVPIHPTLEQTLKNSMGLISMQEECMHVACDFAGFTMAEADWLRKCIGKKMPKEMSELKPKFVQGGMKHVGATEEEANKVWEFLVAFSRYGFCSGHAGAYGVVLLYQTAYLKANWTLPYMTCLINSEAGVTDKDAGYNHKVAEYVEEARAMGIEVLPPCVKQSGPDCKMLLYNGKIRFGLLPIKSLGQDAANWIMQHASQANSLKEFVLRCYEVVEVEDEGQKVKKVYTRVGSGDLTALTYAGALDCFDKDRSKVLAMLPTLQKLAHSYHEQSIKAEAGRRIRIKPEEIKAKLDAYYLEDDQVEGRLSLENMLDKEREYTGCFLSESPFAPFAAKIARQCTTNPAEIQEEGLRGAAVFAGLLTKCSTTIIKNGKSKGCEMAFLAFAGISGTLEVPAFASSWGKIKGYDQDWKKAGGTDDYMARGKVYLVHIEPDRRGTGVNLLDIRRLSNCEEGV